MKKVKMGLLVLGLGGCYDAPRTNPFDPALTPAVELLSVTVDNTSGSATLEWTPYEGQQPFAEYRVLRQVRDRVKVDTLMDIPQVKQTTFRDTTLQPGIVYGYWVEVVNQGGFDVESEKHTEVVYALPSVELLSAEFSSDTATAELVWTQYRGPGFAAYAVRRKAPGSDEEVVKELDEVSDTTYTDSLLDGNTEYTYHIVVRTGWEGVEVPSNERSGKFYPFDHAFDLPKIPDAESQAVGLAVDEQGQLYIARTMRETKSTLGGRRMKKGIRIDLFNTARNLYLFREIRPNPESSIHIVTNQGRIYGSVGLENDSTLVWVVGTEGQVIWAESVDTGGAFPVGLYLEESGKVLMGDQRSFLYSFELEGGPPKQGGTPLQNILESFQFQTAGQMVVGRGVGKEGGDHFFFLAPDQRNYHVLAATRRLGAMFLFRDRTGIAIDEGIGAEKGQTLTPVALAFDSQRQRLLVLEAHGRLQVFNGRYEAQHRYITQWGGVGTGEGEFLISQPAGAAMVVDSQGRIYVADGSGQIQVFAP